MMAKLPYSSDVRLASAYRVHGLSQWLPLADWWEKMSWALSETGEYLPSLYSQLLVLAETASGGLVVLELSLGVPWHFAHGIAEDQFEKFWPTPRGRKLSLPTALRLLGIEPGDPDRADKLKMVILAALDHRLDMAKAGLEQRFREALRGEWPPKTLDEGS